MIELQSYLCGQWRAGRGTPAVLVNPATEPLARASSAGLDPRRRWLRQRGRWPRAARVVLRSEPSASHVSKTLHANRDALIAVSIANCGTPRSDAVRYRRRDRHSRVLRGHRRRLGATDPGGRSAQQLTRSSRFHGYHVRSSRRCAVQSTRSIFSGVGPEKAAVALLAGVPVISKPTTNTALLAFRMMSTSRSVAFQRVRCSFFAAAPATCSHLGDRTCSRLRGRARRLAARHKTVLASSVRQCRGGLAQRGSSRGRRGAGQRLLERVSRCSQRITQNLAKMHGHRRIFVPTERIDAIRGSCDGSPRFASATPRARTLRWGACDRTAASRRARWRRETGRGRCAARRWASRRGRRSEFAGMGTAAGAAHACRRARASLCGA